MFAEHSGANVGQKLAVATKYGFVLVVLKNPGVRHRCIQIFQVYEGAHLGRLRDNSRDTATVALP